MLKGKQRLRSNMKKYSQDFREKNAEYEPDKEYNFLNDTVFSSSHH